MITPEQKRIRSRKYTKRAMDNGRCIFCTSPAEPGRIRCTYHLEISRIDSNERRRKNLSKGICGTCGTRPVREGMKSCEHCANYLSEYHKNKKKECREKGICNRCGKPTENSHTVCPECTPFKGKGGAIRGKILVRDDFTCQVCGSKNFITVHHKDISGASEVPNNSPDNLISVCRSCHKSIHNIIRRLQKEPNLSKMLPIILLPL